MASDYDLSLNNPVVTEKKARGRKRKRSWTRRENKKRRQRGESYETYKDGTVKERRRMKGGCGALCRYRCHQNFSQEQRDKIFSNYWSLGCITLQRNFISSRIHKVLKKRNSKVTCRRSNTVRYTFLVNEQSHRVCKQFFWIR